MLGGCGNGGCLAEVYDNADTLDLEDTADMTKSFDVALVVRQIIENELYPLYGLGARLLEHLKWSFGHAQAPGEGLRNTPLRRSLNRAIFMMKNKAVTRCLNAIMCDVKGKQEELEKT